MPPELAGKKIHVLRISKTGSTTLKSLLDQRTPSASGPRVVMHTHKTTLPDVLQNRGNLVAFFLRDPIARFVSGFRSRVDEVPSARSIPRVAKETVALKHFTSPNQLAEALDSEDEQDQDRAYAAMAALMHAGMHYVDWLVGVDYLQRRRHRIAFIGFQETFDADVQRFLQLLGDEPVEQVPRERPTTRSAADELSDRALANLRTWYADDFAIVDWAHARRDEDVAAAAGTGTDG